jgi:hypothetical protein
MAFDASNRDRTPVGNAYENGGIYYERINLLL